MKYLFSNDAVAASTELFASVYEDNFSKFFCNIDELWKKVENSDKPISDTELEWILIDLPIELFNVSSKLASLTCSCEVLKLDIRKKELTASTVDQKADVIDDKILLTIYQAVCSRVEKQISFCKELIMGAKKIWDGRKRSENVNPISEVNSPSDLPDYIHG